MTERTAVRVTLGVLLGVMAGACWLWSLLAAVFHAGPVLLPCVLGLALLIPAGVLVWTSPDRPSGEVMRVSTEEGGTGGHHESEG